MEKLKLIFSSVLGLPQDQITPALSPDNTASWDSLNAIVLITEIEKGFNLTFTYEEAMAVNDFGGVIDFLIAKGIHLNV